MALAPGTQLGAHQILAAIGSGGMGEVYRARDTRLGRDVAIKVSSDRFSERFEREARAIASLNHPNICTLHDIGPNYLVMELIEGDTLEGPLPLDTAIDYAGQIAAALEAAHEKGIVHRDLKPANIKITSGGVVKVLDFGLAKTAIGSSLPDDSPTALNAQTQTGVILGTAAYMSPEQARGKPVDKRSDIWAFGCVLYEMLTGRRLFEGDTVQESLAAVLKDEPDLSRAPASVQPLLRRCLQKDPRRRLRDIGDAMALLEERPVQSPAETSRHRTRWLWPGLAAAMTLMTVAAGLALWAPWRTTPETEVTRFQIAPPEKHDFSLYLDLSPDGRKLLFTAQSPDGRIRLWVRDMDSLTARQLPGTEITNGFGSPIWSPDNRFIAFLDGGLLKKVDASGTTSPVMLAEVGTNVGRGTWGDGFILLGSRAANPILKVSDAGGTATAVTSLNSANGELTHGFPVLLPDGRHFLYHRGGSGTDQQTQGIYVGSVDLKPEDQPSERLLATYSQAVYVPSPNSEVGQLLFMSKPNGQLLAQPFDANRRVLIGSAVPVAERLGRTGGTYGYGFFSASANGSLAYRTISENRLSWVDRQGKLLEPVTEVGVSGFLRISPDGKRLALDRPSRGNPDIWLFDLERGVDSPITFDPASEDFAIWSPTSDRIVFRSPRNGGPDLYLKAADGTGADQLLVDSDRDKWPDDWSPDGRYLMYEEIAADGKEDLWLVPMDGDRKPIVWIQSPFRESFPQFSPDGRWIAYQSDESGKYEVYVRPFTPPGTSATNSVAAYQVSSGGGERPLWNKGGKELIYVGANRALTAVDVTTNPRFQTGPPKSLFQLTAGIGVRDVALHNDGQRILMPIPIEGGARTLITIIQNWQAALKR
jgi:Tol biopolymer transport system component